MNHKDAPLPLAILPSDPAVFAFGPVMPREIVDNLPDKRAKAVIEPLCLRIKRGVAVNDPVGILSRIGDNFGAGHG